jgi:acetyltransferase
VVAYDDMDEARIAHVIGGALASGRQALTLAEAQQVVGAAGIPVAPWQEARTEAEAVAAAGVLGYPVALKLSSAVLTHKSEVGGVQLNLRDQAGVAAAAAAMLARARRDDPVATLVVARMAPAGTEVIFGASVDPKFGPLLMFGLGGIFVEILEDVAFRVHPIADIDAAEMIEAIKGAPILHGARGHAPVDRRVLRETLLRINHLLLRFPEIQELDINPFFAGPNSESSMAVDARVVIRGRAGAGPRS